MLKRRGRPPKYGTPSKIVAVTLPDDVVTELGGIHEDLGWAIVRLVEQRRQTPSTKKAAADRRRAAGSSEVAAAELVSIGGGQSLIVVNSAAVRSIPGVQMIPLSETEAFLALEPGRGMSDLEIAVLDRIEHLRKGSKERGAVERLLSKLRRWRRDDSLACHPRAIILVEES